MYVIGSNVASRGFRVGIDFIAVTLVYKPKNGWRTRLADHTSTKLNYLNKLEMNA